MGVLTDTRKYFFSTECLSVCFFQEGMTLAEEKLASMTTQHTKLLLEQVHLPSPSPPSPPVLPPLRQYTNMGGS